MKTVQLLTILFLLSSLSLLTARISRNFHSSDVAHTSQILLTPDTTLEGKSSSTSEHSTSEKESNPEILLHPQGKHSSTLEGNSRTEINNKEGHIANEVHHHVLKSNPDSSRVLVGHSHFRKSMFAPAHEQYNQVPTDFPGDFGNFDYDSSIPTERPPEYPSAFPEHYSHESAAGKAAPTSLLSTPEHPTERPAGYPAAFPEHYAHHNERPAHVPEHLDNIKQDASAHTSLLSTPEHHTERPLEHSENQLNQDSATSVVATPSENSLPLSDNLGSFNQDSSTLPEHSEILNQDSTVPLSEHSLDNFDQDSSTLPEHSEILNQDSTTPLPEHSEILNQDSTTPLSEHSEILNQDSTTPLPEHSTPLSQDSPLSQDTALLSNPTIEHPSSLSEHFAQLNPEAALPTDQSLLTNQSSSNSTPAQNPITNPILDFQSVNYLQELKTHALQVIFGFLLIYFSSPILWLRERRTYKVAKYINNAIDACEELRITSDNSHLNSELVIAKGVLKNYHPLIDSNLGISINNSIKIIRHVETYQMVENNTPNADPLGTPSFCGSPERSYMYAPQWISDYKMAGDKKKIFSSQITTANFVHLGIYPVSESQLDQISHIQPFIIPQELQEKIKLKIKKITDELQFAFDPFCFFTDRHIYLQQNFGIDSIGDIRISYDYVPCGKVTFVCSLAENKFAPYNCKTKKFRKFNKRSGKEELVAGDTNCTANCDKCLDLTSCTCCCNCDIFQPALDQLDKINWVFFGQNYNKEEVFNKELGHLRGNDSVTWITRIICLICMTVGYFLLFSPVIGVFGITRYFGGDVVVKALVVALVTGVLTLGDVICMAWFMYKPWVMAFLIAVDTALFCALFVA